ncbi:hypothetical protein D3C80_1427370 [compost metagenome]
MIFEELKRIKYVIRTIAAIEMKRITILINELALSIKTMAFVIAPGPQIIGIASGVIEMSVT